MKIVGRGKLVEFCVKHADAANWIGTWIEDVQSAQWNGPQDIKNHYRSASFLSDNVVIFNVKGNSYRLETKVSYQPKVVMVRWVGTHAQYDRR